MDSSFSEDIGLSTSEGFATEKDLNFISFEEDVTTVQAKPEAKTVEVQIKQVTENAEETVTPITENVTVENETNKGTEEEKTEVTEVNKPKPKQQKKGGKEKPKHKVLSPEELPEGIKIEAETPVPTYLCIFCNCILNSEAMIDTHKLGNRHRKNIQFAKTGVGKFVASNKKASKLDTSKVQTPDAKAQTPVAKVQTPASTLQPYLDKITEPLVGLDEVVEIQVKESVPTFQCNLCQISCGMTSILEHLVGNKHRSSYLRKRVNEEFMAIIKKSLKKGEQAKEFMKLIEKCEKTHGRGNIQVKSSQHGIMKPTSTTTNMNEPSKTEEISKNNSAVQSSETKDEPSSKTVETIDNNASAMKKPSTNENQQSGTVQTTNNNQNVKKSPKRPQEQEKESFRSGNKRPNDSSGNLRDNSQPPNKKRNAPRNDFSSGQRNSSWNDNRRRTLIPSGNEWSSPMSGSDINALRFVGNFAIKNDDDAELVANAINTLTRNLLQYKLYNLPTSLQEVVYNNINKESNTVNKILGMSREDQYQLMERFSNTGNVALLSDPIPNWEGNSSFDRSPIHSRGENQFYERRESSSYGRNDTSSPLYRRNESSTSLYGRNNTSSSLYDRNTSSSLYDRSSSSSLYNRNDNVSSLSRNDSNYLGDSLSRYSRRSNFNDNSLSTDVSMTYKKTGGGNNYLSSDNYRGSSFGGSGDTYWKSYPKY